MSDGIPNPNSYGNRRGAKASAFAPTLRLEINDEKMSQIEEAGLTLKDAESQIVGFFRHAKVNDRLQFTAEEITIVETGWVLTNFRAGIAAIFEIDNVVHLKLTTGDVVAVELYRV